MSFFNADFSRKFKKKNRNFFSSCSLELEQGDFTALYGESGSGKTTLLNMISGLIKPDTGVIRAGSEIWYSSEKKIDLKPWKRNAGYLFQEYRIFETMSVRKNLEYAGGKNNREYIDHLLSVFDLEKHEKRNPALLSGGQKQRLALARCMAVKPKILLLDEPFSAVDSKNRFFLIKQLLDFHFKSKTTIIMVSHSLNEIVNLCNKIAVVKNGKIVNINTINKIPLKRKIETSHCRLKEILNV